MGIPDNPLLLLPLLLPFVVAGGLPSFMNEYDYKQCDDQSCWPTTFHIELWETDVKVIIKNDNLNICLECIAMMESKSCMPPNPGPQHQDNCKERRLGLRWGE